MRKCRIKTNIIAYGPEPAPSDEVEQHLTVSESGRVWFSAYQYGGGSYRRSRSSLLYIGPEAAEEILRTIRSWALQDHQDLVVTDTGCWELTLVESEDMELCAFGSVAEQTMLGGENLSDILRRKIPIDNLFLLDGGADASA